MFATDNSKIVKKLRGKNRRTSDPATACSEIGGLPALEVREGRSGLSCFSLSGLSRGVWLLIVLAALTLFGTLPALSQDGSLVLEASERDHSRGKFYVTLFFSFSEDTSQDTKYSVVGFQVRRKVGEGNWQVYNADTPSQPSQDNPDRLTSWSWVDSSWQTPQRITTRAWYTVKDELTGRPAHRIVEKSTFNFWYYSHSPEVYLAGAKMADGTTSHKFQARVILNSLNNPTYMYSNIVTVPKPEAPSTNEVPPTNIDRTPPQFASAEVDGKLMVISFSEELNNQQLPHPGQFRLIGGSDDEGSTGDQATVADKPHLNKVVVILDEAMSADIDNQELWAIYTKPENSGQGKPLQDYEGNQVGSFIYAGTTIENIGNQGLVFSSATVKDNYLVVVFSKSLDVASSVSPGDFVVNMDGDSSSYAPESVSAPALSQVPTKALILRLGNPVPANASVTVRYSATGANVLKDYSGNTLDDFSGQPVTNLLTTSGSESSEGDSNSELGEGDSNSGSGSTFDFEEEITTDSDDYYTEVAGGGCAIAQAGHTLEESAVFSSFLMASLLFSAALWRNKRKQFLDVTSNRRKKTAEFS